jgi:tousled-like kinase
MKDFAVDCLSKYSTAGREMTVIDLLQKQQRLGTVTTVISGNPRWTGGIDVMRAQTQIADLTRQAADAKGHHKSSLQTALKETKQQLKTLEDQRINLIYELRQQAELDESKFRVTQELDNGKYVLTRYIGRGGFSEVWEALDVLQVQRVAVKIQRMDPQWPPVVKKNFLRHAGREIKIMSSTQHPNVVAFYGYFYVDENSVALVMEYCDGGDLAQLLRRRGKLAEKQARGILIEMIQGLVSLRSKDNCVIHYDLKPGNILFDAEGTVKITDFGLSKVVEGDVTALELTSQGTGTYYYAPPETFQRGGNVMITPSVDTWSIGIIFYEMLYGVRPFGSDMSQLAFAQRSDELFAESLEFPPVVKVSEPAKDFIRMCLEREPLRRPNLDQIAQAQYCRPDFAVP